jgi:hypothetical protein
VGALLPIPTRPSECKKKPGFSPPTVLLKTPGNN